MKDALASLAHELRGPLTILRGFAEILQEEENPSAAFVREISKKMVHTSCRLEKILQSLLKLADLERGIDQKPVDLVDLLQSCKQELFLLYPKVEVVLDLSSSPLVVLGEKELLFLALMNLLENGAKYAGKRLEVKASINKERVSLQIQDFGPGIAPEHLPHIFERFYVVDRRKSRKLGGTGLGLSLVKLIIEKHQGEVSVSSKVEQGSIFSVTLLISPSEEKGKLCSDNISRALF